MKNKSLSSLLCVFTAQQQLVMFFWDWSVTQDQNAKVWTYYCQTVPKLFLGAQASPLLKRDSPLGDKALTFLSSADAHHVPGVGHQEVLSHVSRKQVEQDSLVVQLHLLHVTSLLFCLERSQKGQKSWLSVTVMIAHGDVVMVPNSDGEPVIAYLYH